MSLLEKIKSALGLETENNAMTVETENNTMTVETENDKILAEIRALPDNTEKLDLSERPLTSLAGVKLPSGLKRLDLGFTQISSLTGVIFPEGLQQLTLDFTPLSSLENISFPNGLKRLRLQGTPITNLRGVTFPANLEILLLSNSELNTLDGAILPRNLRMLWLDESKLTTLSESIRGLKKMYYLDLSNLALNELPDWLPELGLPLTRIELGDGISLYNTTVEGVDMSIFDQSQETILEWFKEYTKQKQQKTQPIGIDFGNSYSGSLEQEPEDIPAPEHTGISDSEDVPESDQEEAKPLNELKVVFLGDGGAGKSHTIARLKNNGGQTEDFPNISTPGIAITDKPYKFGNKDIKVHYWDFGGQEILHSMHRMFLTERTLYVVMLNVRDGTQNDRARYWLYNLRSFAKGAPVLLVLNQMDLNENASLNENDLRKLYPNLAPEIVRLSTLKNTDKEFEEKFINVLRKQISSMDILDFPFIRAWNSLKERLQNMETPYIFADKFHEYCDECGVTDSSNIRRDLLNWFSDLGVSFCYSGSASLEDYVVLRPDWITNAIYIVLFNKAEAANNGQVSHEVIYRMLSSKDTAHIRRTVTNATYKPHEVDYVLKVFRKFRLSFLAVDGIEFLPMLCDANAKPISTVYEDDPDALEFRMRYEYLPDNVIHRLMVDRRRELQLKNVWLYGGQFRNDCTGLSAVVKTEGNVLRIMVRREDSQCQPQLYLNALKKDIERISTEMGLTVENKEVVYKAEGKTACFDYEDLLFAQEMGDTHISCKELRKKIPIADILKQSGHSADKAQVDLLTDIVRYCEMLQDDNTTWDKSEDERTTYIRNLLRAKGYIANDQSRGGISGGDGKQAGELDLDIRLDPAERLSIFEALNLEGSAASYQDYWNRHLDKLLDNYNATGCPFLFHVTYLSCAKSTFTKHCVTFEDHLRYYHPVGFSLTSERPTDPLTKRGIRHGGFLRAMETVYDCGGIPMTVYHFFVRIGE